MSDFGKLRRISDTLILRKCICSLQTATVLNVIRCTCSLQRQHFGYNMLVDRQKSNFVYLFVETSSRSVYIVTRDRRAIGLLKLL